MNEPTPAAERASRSSFYNGMRILPRAQRNAMFEIYSFCRAVDDIADDPGPRDERSAALERWRSDLAALYGGLAPPHLLGLAQAIRNFDLAHGDFLAVIAGMEMDVVSDIRAPDLRDTRSLLRPRRLRGRTAFGAGIRPGARCRSGARPSSRPRAAADQYFARPRRGCLAGTALSAARGAARCRHHQHRSGDGAGQSDARRSLQDDRRAGESRVRSKPQPIMAQCPRRAVRAPRIMARGLSPHSRPIDRAWLCAAARRRCVCRAPRFF